QRITPITNRNLPNGLAKGVSDLGIKYQIGPVSSTIVINNTMPLDTRTPSESGMVSSPSRFESYQIFSTDARRVIILKGEKTMRATKTGNCSTARDRTEDQELSHVGNCARRLLLTVCLPNPDLGLLQTHTPAPFPEF